MTHTDPERRRVMDRETIQSLIDDCDLVIVNSLFEGSYGRASERIARALKDMLTAPVVGEDKMIIMEGICQSCNRTSRAKENNLCIYCNKDFGDGSGSPKMRNIYYSIGILFVLIECYLIFFRTRL